jgi:hypothetical protein
MAHPEDLAEPAESVGTRAALGREGGIGRQQSQGNALDGLHGFYTGYGIFTVGRKYCG